MAWELSSTGYSSGAAYVLAFWYSAAKKDSRNVCATLCASSVLWQEPRADRQRRTVIVFFIGYVDFYSK